MASNNEHLVRHRLHIEAVPRGTSYEVIATCTHCGISGEPSTLLRHIKASRRWRYLGVEVVAGEAYHMWEHQLTGRRYAWLITQYQAKTSRAVK